MPEVSRCGLWNTDGENPRSSRIPAVSTAMEFMIAMFSIVLLGPTRLSSPSSARIASPGSKRPVRAARLTTEHRVTAAVTAHSGTSYVRVCGQLYNRPTDYKRLAAALPGLLSGLPGLLT